MNFLAIVLKDLVIAISLFSITSSPAQEGAEGQIPNRDGIGELAAGRAFSATKYARLVSVSSDGRLHFVRSERHPSRIARDANGRIMMQYFENDVLSECRFPTLPNPPPCPVWNVFVIDPISHIVAHWPEGELAAHVALDMPLSEENLELAERLTSDMPDLGVKLETDVSTVRNQDLGERMIDGIPARGERTTIFYPAGYLGRKQPTSRVHEVWVAPEMRLIVRVVDGDPHGLERISGIEKISRNPDPSDFLPPDGYEIQHQNSGKWAERDFEELKLWFQK